MPTLLSVALELLGFRESDVFPPLLLQTLIDRGVEVLNDLLRLFDLEPRTGVAGSIV